MKIDKYSFIIDLNNIKQENRIHNINSIFKNRITNNIYEIIYLNANSIQMNLIQNIQKTNNISYKIIPESISKDRIISEIIDSIHGEYIIFLNNIIELNFIEALNNHINEINSNIIKLRNTNKTNKKNSFKIIDLNENSYNNIDSTSFLIIKKSILDNYYDMDDFNIINRILLKDKQYAEFYVEDIVEQKQKKEITYHDYNQVLENCINLLNYTELKYNHIPRFIENSILYYIQDYINNLDNLNEKTNKLLIKNTQQLIKRINLQTIIKNYQLNQYTKKFLVFLKNDQIYSVEVEESNLLMKTNDFVIDKLNIHKIWLDLIDIKNNFLYISGLLLTNFNNESIEIKLKNKLDSTEYTANFREYTQDGRKILKFFSIPWRFSYNFDIKVPIDKIINKALYFEVKFHENNLIYAYNPEIAFRIHAELSTSSIYSIKESKITYLKNQYLYVENFSYKKMFTLEYGCLKKIFNNKQNGYKLAIVLRLIYVFTYYFMKNRKIWLFNDRPEYADDNAINLFKYAITKTDGSQKYFIIKKDSKDYQKLSKQYNNIIAYGSLKYKLYTLYASKLITSFVNEDYHNPFYISYKNNSKELYSGLLNHNKYFLQHGITLGDVSNSIKKYNINLSLIVTSSDLERNSFLKKGYGFDKEIIQTLGLPRYDNLVNNPKNQIVLMPTWRVGIIRNKENFIKSDYFIRFNSLINNERLNKFLKNNNIIMKFKPHPEILKYIECFDIPKTVEIGNESYNKIFAESKVLITDYSSVAFDFAYLKKPVLYYQQNDEYNYKKGYFDFNTMGFGEILTTENEIVDKIIKYCADFKMEEKYQKRVDNFFKFQDKENCKRVYEWIKNN